MKKSEEELESKYFKDESLPNIRQLSSQKANARNIT